MKISEMSTDKVLDVLCEITPAINSIITDDELLSQLKSVVSQDDKELTTAQLIARGVEKVNAIIPILLKKHKEDAFSILAALSEKTCDEIAKQKSLVTLKQIKEIAQDKELIDFFKSCVNAEGGE